MKLPCIFMNAVLLYRTHLSVAKSKLNQIWENIDEKSRRKEKNNLLLLQKQVVEGGVVPPDDTNISRGSELFNLIFKSIGPSPEGDRNISRYPSSNDKTKVSIRTLKGSPRSEQLGQ